MAEALADPVIELVDDATRLETALASVDAPTVGVDVERADADRYYRSPALVQVGVAGRCILVDPVELVDLGPLDEFLTGRCAVFHAIENDLAPLAAVDVEPDEVADTGVAAALLGMPTGLGPLLDEVLGVRLTADKERYQRADWEARPLTDGMLAYAAGDVVHLPALWAELERRLDEAGRRSWYDEELEATIAAAEEDRRDWDRTKGSGRLDAQQRAVLRALWEERETIAKEHDIAPGRLLRDRALVDLAAEPASSPRDLVRRNQRRRAPTADFAERLFAAQQRGQQAEPEDRSGGRRWDERHKAAYDAMRRSRAELADEIGIDPGVLCSSRPLWGAILSEPENADDLCVEAGLRQWQTELLSERLWEIYVRETSRGA